MSLHSVQADLTIVKIVRRSGTNAFCVLERVLRATITPPVIDHCSLAIRMRITSPVCSQNVLGKVDINNKPLSIGRAYLRGLFRPNVLIFAACYGQGCQCSETALSMFRDTVVDVESHIGVSGHLKRLTKTEQQTRTYPV